MDKHPDGPPRNEGRKKWDKGDRGDGPDRSHGSGVQLMGENWMCFCKRTACRWNLAHTSVFHAAWENNKSKFSLLATHKFCIKYGTATVTSSKGDPSTELLSSGYPLTRYFLRHAGALAQQNGDKTKSVLEH